MTIIQPRTPAGTLELLPREQAIFQHMLDTIRRGYERFGFIPIETPVFELKDVLLTKSGGETEKQVYLVQSTGGEKQGYDADLALRFDLTVPLARYVAEHERDLAFPFRRYQIQRVYRGERAQRGRFREFYQCDIDVIGKDHLSPAFDAELPAIIAQIFEELKIGEFKIHFSNRKILRGLLNCFNIKDEEKQKLVLRAIDKIDKIGIDKVRDSLSDLGLPENGIQTIESLVRHEDKGSEAKLHTLKHTSHSDALLQQGVEELEGVFSTLKALGVPNHRWSFNPAITRGLDYYTGTVYETFIDAHPEFGSICSGGRYENLASHYTKSKLPGVGISIGLTRLFDQLNANNLLPTTPHPIDILITQFDPVLMPKYLELASSLRQAGFNVENYMEPAKLDKQLKYANKTGIPLVLIMGSDEVERGEVTLKNMAANSQQTIKKDNLVSILKTLTMVK